MPEVISRSVLTDAILAALVKTQDDPETWEVGDHEKPEAGGWPDGVDPNSPDATFIPFVILTALRSQRPSGPVGQPQADVVFPYGFTCYGDSRRQVERVADVSRRKASALFKQKTSDGRRIINVWVAAYGGVDRISRKPPLYAVTDQIEFWTTA